MAQHAFSAYMSYGWPGDEVRPLSCTTRTWNNRSRGTLDDALGGYALTLVDALDTLALLGDLSAFRCAVSRVVAHVSFDRDVYVSVFEASIRVVGGLLSAHLLSVDAELRIWERVACGDGGESRRHFFFLFWRPVDAAARGPYAFFLVSHPRSPPAALP
jgi:hypothetical protein